MFANNCRICLSDQSDNVTLLFTTVQNEVKSPSEMGQMYLDCLRLELIDNQNYPKHICNYCKLQLSVFHNFMMMAKRSHDKFTESGIVVKAEKIWARVPKIEELHHPYDPDGDAQKSLINSRRNSDAEYLDSEMNETSGFDVSDIGDSIFNELTAEQQEDDNIDDCLVEYLEEDDVMLTNVKNEIIDVKDDHDAQNHGEKLEDDVISLPYNSDDDDSSQILETLSKASTISTFYHIKMIDRDIEDEDEIIYQDEIVQQNDKRKFDFECKHCNSMFSSSRQLQEHYTAHPDCKLDCDVCGKKFKTRIMYQSHMNVHNGLPAFKCEMCDKTFNFRSNYQTHMLLHTNERPYPCDICEKGFRSKWDLIIHTRVHNDIRKYECKICGKRFRVSSHLTSHQYTHAAEKNFQCDVCHQHYNSPRTLKQHKNTVHSNNFRFYCSQCDKKFKRKHHVLSHLKTHYKHSEGRILNAVELEFREQINESK